MTPPFVDSKDSRIRAAKAFAEQFNPFEWKFLCSHQWFITAIDRALQTGNFLSLQIRAEQALIDGKIRRQTSPVTIDGCVRDNPEWIDYYS
jgi:hypothetical protein